MARRTRKWQPVGSRLKRARKDAGLTLEQLSKRTGVSKSSLGRFESDRAVPGFGDICVIAQQLGWPLLFFATGVTRSGDDSRALIANLRFWGLRDIWTSDVALLGETRNFEELFANVVARPVEPRVLAALPALLLRNQFDPNRLVSLARGVGSLRRVGWLAEVAEHVSRHLPTAAVHPEAPRRLSEIESAASESVRARSGNDDDFDYFGAEAAASDSVRAYTWEKSPALARRWRVANDTGIEEFIERASSILTGP